MRITKEEAKEWRLKNHMSQEKLAGLIEVGILSYSRFERGKSMSMHAIGMRALEGLIKESERGAKVAEGAVSYGKQAPEDALCVLARKFRSTADIIGCQDLHIDVRVEELVTFFETSSKALKAYIVSAGGKTKRKSRK